jgi:ligand-binding sensor domain-containing protein
MRSILLAVIALFLAAPSYGLDPTRYLSQYGHTAWRLQDGAFAGAPDAIAQTTDGYLWLGTQSGLLRFDGVRFVPFAPPTKERLFYPSIVSHR